jgi:hypothetical protein
LNTKEAFLVREWNSFYLPMKKLVYLHLKDFLKYECEPYVNQPMTPPQLKGMLLTAPQNIDLIEIGWW